MLESHDHCGQLLCVGANFINLNTFIGTFHICLSFNISFVSKQEKDLVETLIFHVIKYFEYFMFLNVRVYLHLSPHHSVPFPT